MLQRRGHHHVRFKVDVDWFLRPPECPGHRRLHRRHHRLQDVSSSRRRTSASEEDED